MKSQDHQGWQASPDRVSHFPTFSKRDRPIHISYGQQQKRDIWTFTPTGQPTRKGIQN